MTDRSPDHSPSGQGKARAAAAAPPETDGPDTLARLLNSRRPKILVVEDNRTNLLVIRQFLKSLRAEITCAENGRMAVLAAAEAPFDIILMDIQMPELDGVGATREIRSMERAGQGRPRAVIVATTANTMAHQVEEYLAAEMDAWIAKPIGKAALFEVLAGLVPAEPRA